MGLSQELTTFREQFLGSQPEEIVATMARTGTELATSGVVENALKAGDRLPACQLPNATGKTVDVRALLAQGPVVLAFYRGEWCPYCNLELRALQQALPEIQALGATLVAISPQTPDASLSTAEKNELAFEVLSDVGNQFARTCGLVFTLAKELHPIYAGFGINVPAHNGDDTFELPLPATYIVAQDGTIAQAFVDADYTLRMEPAEIIA
ncbi:MAG: peroxiredoxin-like family protein, partial [Cyanobacteria bacterium J06641_5]